VPRVLTGPRAPAGHKGRRGEPQSEVPRLTVADIELTEEARSFLATSDDPRRTHFNIMLAEITLRILRLAPDVTDEQALSWGYDQSSLDFAREVLAGIRPPLVDVKLSLERSRLREADELKLEIMALERAAGLPKT
jgi:hypothetical protein